MSPPRIALLLFLLVVAVLAQTSSNSSSAASTSPTPSLSLTTGSVTVTIATSRAGASSSSFVTVVLPGVVSNVTITPSSTAAPSTTANATSTASATPSPSQTADPFVLVRLFSPQLSHVSHRPRQQRSTQPLLSSASSSSSLVSPRPSGATKTDGMSLSTRSFSYAHTATPGLLSSLSVSTPFP